MEKICYNNSIRFQIKLGRDDAMISGISGVGASVYTAWSSMQRQRPSAMETAQQRPAAAEDARQAPKTSGVWTARKSAAPETPVQPVDAAKPVSAQAQGSGKLGLPIREGADPVEMAVRMRIQYEEPQPELSQKAPELSGTKNLVPELEKDAPKLSGKEEPSGAEAAQAAVKEGECQTCKKRKYQDESDDMGVSFQTPTNVAPEQAASAVRGHEREHVVREQAKAEREDRKVVSQNVTIHTDICPECGEAFVSGGTTTTTTKADNSGAEQQQQQQAQQQNEKRTPFSAVA